jgi:hypothetical protein
MLVIPPIAEEPQAQDTLTNLQDVIEAARSNLGGEEVQEL